MIKHKIFTVVLLIVCLTTNIYSQKKVSVHFGPSFPVLEFESDDATDKYAGGATIGLNLGFQYTNQLFKDGLGMFFGADISYNGLKSSIEDEIEEYYNSKGIYITDIKYYKYINIPITAGVNYTCKADEKISVFANGGLALNFLKITNMEIKANGRTVTSIMFVSNNIGFKIGGGVLINNKYSISLDYYGLGKYNIKGIVSAIGYSQEIDSNLKVDLFTLTFGINIDKLLK